VQAFRPARADRAKPSAFFGAGLKACTTPIRKTL
jgi:hypothetical protein